MEIRWIAAENIDKNKWNGCVHYAGNGNIFGYKWYLDSVAKEWDALIENDYESVFPLIYRPMWGKHRELYQPSLLRESGIYSVNVLSPKRVQAFLGAIPEEYRRIDIALNEQHPAAPEAYETSTHTNYQLWLQDPYDTISERFSKDLQVLLSSAAAQAWQVIANIKPEQIAALYRKQRPFKDGEFRFHALHRIMYNALHRGWGFGSGVQDKNGHLMAANFWLYSHGKVVSLSPAAVDPAAQALLFDALIQSHAGRPLLLDFNVAPGEDWPAGFGAAPNPYFRLQKDKRWLGIL